jgi:hypothetical protein
MKFSLLFHPFAACILLAAVTATAQSAPGPDSPPPAVRTVAALQVPRPEHPRPDFYRENWLSLNGEWQFEIDETGDGETRGLTCGKNLADKIVVPFCPESKLSGLGYGNTRKLKHAWYRRHFELPAAMRGQRVRIHFEAVDYFARVFVNGQIAGEHSGCSAGFAFDITHLLKQEGPNEVVVRVKDDQWSGLQPRGKQTNNESHNVFYTRTTGIWQPVWLEAVGSSFVREINLTSDPDHSRILLQAEIDGHDPDLALKAEAFADGRLVGSATATGPWQQTLVIDLSQKKLWHPGTPFLYDLRLTLTSGGKTLDTLQSYFGLRKVAIDGRRILINDQPVFQRLILDQGFYPDGIWTAPSDEELRSDIERAMACGFNGARLHQKVFEKRFLYWADKLGYLVWGETSNAGYDNRREGFANYVNEWTELLRRDRNHPSIIGWCPFNENSQNPEQAAELQQMVWNITKAVDPTRPALETSGWTHTLPHPEVRDFHDYAQDPAQLRTKWLNYFIALPEGPFPPRRYYDPAHSPADRGVPFMVSEFGGIGWATEGGWGYGKGPKTLDEFYARYEGQVYALLDNPNFFGFCYTQLTDIEQEKNGLFYYDRKPKFDNARLKQITSRQAAYETNAPMAPPPEVKTIDANWKVLLGAVQDGNLSTAWQYSLEKPAENWASEGFDDSTWKSGLAPFASTTEKRTEWTDGEIHCRKKFEFDGAPLKHAALVLRNNGKADVWLNGEKILSSEANRGYQLHLLTEVFRNKIRKGTNTIALHSQKQRNATCLDLAILIDDDTRDAKKQRPTDPAPSTGSRWSSEKANQWYARQPWLCGFNYIPAHAISYTEMWLPYNFDVVKIDKELSLAQDIGFNCLRVVLPFVVWEHDPEAFKQRLREFLDVCDKRGIKVMFCIFEDCGEIRNPTYGKQPDVLKGAYANAWSASPGDAMVLDPATWPRLEKYLKDIIGTFKDDPGVLAWDLYNEPTNGGMGNRSLPLLTRAFEWARAVNPIAPLTVGVWNENQQLNAIALNNSDILTFHNYHNAKNQTARIKELKSYGRPILNTEWLCRHQDSTPESCLPLFARENVCCMHWGLVNGRSQTHLHWGAQPGDAEPDVWQHDLYLGDHTPYQKNEIELFRRTIRSHSAKTNSQ